MNRKKGGKRFNFTIVNDRRKKMFELFLFLASLLFIFTEAIFKTTFGNARTSVFLFFLWRHQTLPSIFIYIILLLFSRAHALMIYELRRSKVNQFIFHKNIFYVCTHPLNQDWVCKQRSSSLIDDKGEGFISPEQKPHEKINKAFMSIGHQSLMWSIEISIYSFQLFVLMS